MEFVDRDHLVWEGPLVVASMLKMDGWDIPSYTRLMLARDGLPEWAVVEVEVGSLQSVPVEVKIGEVAEEVDAYSPWNLHYWRKLVERKDSMQDILDMAVGSSSCECRPPNFDSCSFVNCNPKGWEDEQPGWKNLSFPQWRNVDEVWQPAVECTDPKPWQEQDSGKE